MTKVADPNVRQTVLRILVAAEEESDLLLYGPDGKLLPRSGDTHDEALQLVLQLLEDVLGGPENAPTPEASGQPSDVGSTTSRWSYSLDVLSGRFAAKIKTRRGEVKAEFSLIKVIGAIAAATGLNAWVQHASQLSRPEVRRFRFTFPDGMEWPREATELMAHIETRCGAKLKIVSWGHSDPLEIPGTGRVFLGLRRLDGRISLDDLALAARQSGALAAYVAERGTDVTWDDFDYVRTEWPPSVLPEIEKALTPARK